MSDNHDLLNDNDMCSNNDITACGDGVPSVKKSPINQRISPFLE